MFLQNIKIIVLILFIISVKFIHGEFTPPAEKIQNDRYLFVPFAFYNETLEWTVGAMGGVGDLLDQREAVIKGGGMISSNESFVGFGSMSNFIIPGTKRLLFGPDIKVGKYAIIQSYSNGNYNYYNSRYNSGSNDSDKDNYLEVNGVEINSTLYLKYILPIGDGGNMIIPQARVISGAKSWNPLKSGRTMLEVNPFYRSLDIKTEDIIPEKEMSVEIITSGLQFALTHENMNFRNNPSNGSYKQLLIRRDFGLFDSNNSWTTIEGTYTKYFPLMNSNNQERPKVLALSFWTANCLTWDSGHRAPYHSGANLGGLFRMRGYPAGRFNDKAAIYYAAEYRHTSEWNGLRDMALLQMMNINVDWIQYVLFGEIGRVNDEWDLQEFHEDMKWDVGGGLRFSIDEMVVRVDVAVSNDEVGVQMYYDHPFFLR